jgi:mono/diheme cytochrome c family protein
MRPQTLMPVLVLVAAVAGMAVPGTRAAEQLDGKAVFTAQKCETCHAVSSAGIKATGKVKAPDLAGTAAKHDATLLASFLRKKADVNGKKHIKPFTGTDEEMGALIAWLQQQKKTP